MPAGFYFSLWTLTWRRRVICEDGVPLLAQQFTHWEPFWQRCLNIRHRLCECGGPPGRSNWTKVAWPTRGSDAFLWNREAWVSVTWWWSTYCIDTMWHYVPRRNERLIWSLFAGICRVASGCPEKSIKNQHMTSPRMITDSAVWARHPGRILG